MDNTGKKTSIMTLFLIGGAYISFVIGASFGTGQELIQYFSSYGIKGILGALISVLLIIVMLIMVFRDAQKYRLENLRMLFIHYGGKYLGTVLYVYTVFYLFVLVVMLIAGAGAVFSDYFGINNLLGRFIMAAVLFITVILGLNRLLDILGKISFLIIILMLFVAVVCMINPADGLQKGDELIKDVDVLQPASNWFMSAIMYFSWAILCQVSYAAGLSKNTAHTESELTRGLITGGIGIIFLTVLPSAAILANISIVGDSSIPNIILARSISPVIGVIFSLVVITMVYTTCAPLVWSVSTAFIDQEKKWFKAAVGGTVVIAFVGSNVGSFAEILNKGTSISAYVGFVFLATVIITKLFRKMKAPDISESDQESQS